MKNFLNSVKVAAPKSNEFDLSHDVKMSINMGNLYPICCIDAVPGDKFTIGCEALARLAPMVAPMMHRVDVSMHYYFVPKRILWKHWEAFITKTKISGSVPAHPFISYTNVTYDTYKLCDYLGLPRAGVTYGISAFPFAAYQLIYQEYYRDQNLVAPIWEIGTSPLNDGDNNAQVSSLCALRKRSWEHDYFTACLPFAQKGDAVSIPISGSGDVTLKDFPLSPWLVRNSTTGAPDLSAGGLAGQVGTGKLESGGVTPVVLDPTGGFADSTLEANITNADTTINDLRKAYALQRFMEKLARGGTRLTEFIRTIFGVVSSDARLQRPEYITGTKTPIVISEVLNTTGTVDAPQGTMAGHGAGAVSGNYGNFFCEEHGILMGILSVMPKTAYQQGIPKQFLKINNSEEHYLPDFANIGEQEVLKCEVYADSVDPNGTFGYMPRYSEYKFENNRVAGDFKTSLDYWHMGRIFGSEPALNQQFVECDPTYRVFAVDDDGATDHVWMHVFNKIYARRLMPKYGTPTF